MTLGMTFSDTAPKAQYITGLVWREAAANNWTPLKSKRSPHKGRS